MEKVSTTGTTDTRFRIEELEPGRYSVKFTPSLSVPDGGEFLRMMEAEHPEHSIIGVIGAVA